MRQMPPTLPTFDSMMLPTIQALKELGGSGTTDEILAKVAELLNLPNAVLDIPHGQSSSGEVEYRPAWTRTYLKKYGLLDNSARGIWSLNVLSRDLKELDQKEIVKSVRGADKVKSMPPKEAESASVTSSSDTVSVALEEDGNLAWHEKLHSTLVSLTPQAFERLTQRLLRESGFIQVEVTGKSGDGGIDGIGIARINGFLSFHVLFQCKRYQGAITPSQIRDFRGAMQGAYGQRFVHNNRYVHKGCDERSDERRRASD